MPVVVEATTASGKKIRKKLPVEIWERNKSFDFKIDTKEPLVSVQLDPDHVFRSCYRKQYLDGEIKQ